MHDWILKSVLLEWAQARATLVFGNGKALVAEGVVDLHVPQKREWGSSTSVNKVVGPTDVGAGVRRLAIEMQTGDVITVTARTFDIPTEQD